MRYIIYEVVDIIVYYSYIVTSFDFLISKVNSWTVTKTILLCISLVSKIFALVSFPIAF